MWGDIWHCCASAARKKRNLGENSTKPSPSRLSLLEGGEGEANGEVGIGNYLLHGAPLARDGWVGGNRKRGSRGFRASECEYRAARRLACCRRSRSGCYATSARIRIGWMRASEIMSARPVDKLLVCMR